MHWDKSITYPLLIFTAHITYVSSKFMLRFVIGQDTSTVGRGWFSPCFAAEGTRKVLGVPCEFRSSSLKKT